MKYILPVVGMLYLIMNISYIYRMRLQIPLIFIFLSFSLSVFGQDKKMVLSGEYNGKNLYVQNPFNPDLGYCTKKITINGKNYDFNFNASAYEINFSKLSIDLGTKLKIIIEHSDNCLPKVLNSEVIIPDVSEEIIEERKSSDGKILERGEFKDGKLWDGERIHYDTKGDKLKSEAVEDGVIRFTLDEKKFKKWVADIYTLENDFHDFIQYENITHSFSEPFETIRKFYLNGKFNKMDEDGNMTGIWIITTNNKEYVARRTEISAEWLDSMKLAFAELNEFNVVDNTLKYIHQNKHPDLRLKKSVSFKKREIVLDYYFPQEQQSKKLSQVTLPVPSKNDTILEVGFFWNSLKTGIWFLYDSDGKLKAKIEHRLGKPDGMAIVYYPNGIIREMGQWQVNRWVGTYQLFNEKGRLKQQYHFNSLGQREGIIRNYHENGLIQKIGTMEEGKENGYFLSYDSLGTLSGISYCRYGKCNDTLLADTSEIEILRSFVRNENQIIFRSKKLVSAQQDIKTQKSELEKEKAQRMLLYGGIIGIAIISLSLVFFVMRLRKSRKVIETQKKQTEHQKEIIEEKQKEIIDSINYAKRIQYTLLAHEPILNKNLNDHFVLFLPKDIVSGDFYWASELIKEGRKEFYLAVCDSTGHGIPGAFMSLLNISFLNESINEMKMDHPGKIFDHIRNRLIKNISQDGAKDGMDGILLKYSNGKMEYSAANNVPVVVSNGEIRNDLPFDKMPIGMGNKEENFSSHELKAEKGDMVYLYTDGFADQFGGSKGKKYKYKRLNEFLVSISDLDSDTQRSRLKEEFENWRGDLEQVDDVCIIGIRI